MAKNLVRLACLAAALVLPGGCSLMINSQISCESNADCTSPAVCIDGLCVANEPPDASEPGEDAGQLEPDAGPGRLVFALEIAGQPVAGQAVTLTVSARAGGQVDPTYVGTVSLSSTDPQAQLPNAHTFLASEQGMHAFGGVVFGTAGQVTVTAIDPVNDITGQLQVTVAAGEVSELAVTGLPASLGAGQRADVRVTAVDRFGNTVPSYTGTVGFSSTDTAASLPSDYTFASGDNGTHLFALGVQLNSVGQHTVTATDRADTSITGTSGSVVVTSGAAARLSVVVAEAVDPIPAGTPLTVTVTALDANDNVATEYTGSILFTTNAPDPKTLPPPYTFTAADLGTKTFAAPGDTVVFNRPGTFTLTATDTATATINGTQGNIQVVVGPPSRLAFAGSVPEDCKIGSPIPSFGVRIEDLGGNLVNTATDAVTVALLTSPTDAELTGQTTVNAVSGVATFAGLQVDLEGTYRLRATSGSLSAAESRQFTASKCDPGYTGPDCEECAPGYNRPTDDPEACVDACSDDVLGNPCTNPGPPTCSGNLLITETGPGTCTRDLSGEPWYTCDYPEDMQDCAPLFCDPASPSCVDPCATNTCTPDAATCEADETLVTYQATCTGTSATTYDCGSEVLSSTPCGTEFCDAAAQACVDPCETMPADCVSGAAATCSADNKTMTTYTPTCTGTGAHSYTCGATVDQVTDCGAGFCNVTPVECVNPCDPMPASCTDGPAACSDQHTYTTYTATCTPTDATSFVCDPLGLPSSTDCGEGFCDLGAPGGCANPCQPTMPADCVAAVDPPTCSADATTLTTYAPTCTPTGPGSGEYTCGQQGTPIDCTQEVPSGQVCFGAACVALPAPQAADLLITEVMANPSVGGATHKWLEIRNLSSSDLNLAGLTIENPSSTALPSFTVPADSPALLLAGGYFVFGGSTDPLQNGGAAVDRAWPAGFDLGAAGDLSIKSGTTTLEQFSWDETSLPNASGAAMSLSSRTFAKGANAHPWWWCDATSTYGTDGQLGTPGADNADCGVPAAPTIDACHAQWMNPAQAGVATDAFGQLMSPGITDRNTDGIDFYPYLVGEVGYGPVGTTDGSTFTWIPAAFNPSFTGPSSNDEMMASVTFPAAGDYVWGYRFGFLDPANPTAPPLTWIYCDGDPSWAPLPTPVSNAWPAVTVAP